MTLFPVLREKYCGFNDLGDVAIKNRIKLIHGGLIVPPVLLQSPPRSSTKDHMKISRSLGIKRLKQVIRFLIVGGINTLFGYSCFASLLFIGLHYTIASFLGTVLGVLFNFKTTGVLVFRSNNNRLIYRFFASYLATYLINIVAIAVLSTLGFSPYIAGLMLILPMAVFSFILNQKFVFNHD